MRTYPGYKDSDVEWIGKIPKGWEIKRFKYSSDFIVEKELPSDGDIKISPENVEPYSGKVMNYHSDYETEGMKFREGDTLLNKLRVYLSKFVFCESDGFSMGEMLVLRPREYLPKFQYYLLSSPKIIDHFNSLSQGVKVPRPPVNEMLNTLCPVVPLSEQKQISDYLDRKTQQIDDLSEKTERKIELLKEQRSSLINHCVTKGLDPKVEMKDSGVKWIGEIPRGWEIIPLRYNTKKIGSGVTPRGGSEVYSETGIPFLRSQNIHFRGLSLEDVVYISEEMHESMSGSKVQSGDVLINITGGSIGRCCFINDFTKYNVNQHVCIVRPKKQLETRFLNYFLSSQFGQFQVKLNITGSGREGLNFENLGNFSVPKISLPEQKQISDYLDQETRKIDQMIDTETKRSNLLKEYRQSLISSVVTGKIDVRGEVVQ